MTRAGIGVGGLRRRHLDDGEEVLNLYYRLAAAHHGRGLGKEAARAWTAHALEWLPPLPVVAKSREINERSLRAALAAGLEPAGTTDDGPEGEPPSQVLRAPRVESPDVVRRPDPRVGARPVVRGQRHRGSGRLPPGAPRHEVASTLAAHEEGMADGGTSAVLLRGTGGRVVGLGFWVADPNPLLAHARTAYRIMTHPEMRGRNLGRLLMAAMHRVAREQDVEVAVLDVRSGLGTTRFYEGSGYVEVGRVPGVIRVGPADDRDSVLMARRLDGRPMVADGRA